MTTRADWFNLIANHKAVRTSDILPASWVGLNRMSSKQPPTKRKKKPSKSLLVRLSESCNSHKKNCHDNDDNENQNHNESGNSSEQCTSDMKALKKIIPIIESACRCQHGPGHGQDDQHQNNSRQMDGIKRGKDIVNPKEVMHLCFF